MDFSVVKKSGLRITEFAKMAKVSRATVYNWFKGEDVHPLHRDKIAGLLKLLGECVENGSLPVDSCLGGGERTLRIKETLVKHMKK